MLNNFHVLAVGEAEDLEVSIDYDNKYKVYMNIDVGPMFVYFLTEIQEEDRLLKAIISYLKNDGEVVWKGATQMILGKFGDFKVELVNNDESVEHVILLIANRNAKASMRYDLNKQVFMEACKNALADLC
jgi:hypothetical protein